MGGPFGLDQRSPQAVNAISAGQVSSEDARIQSVQPVRPRPSRLLRMSVRLSPATLHALAPRCRPSPCGEPATLRVENTGVRVVSTDGELLAEFTIDPARNYQPKNQA